MLPKYKQKSYILDKLHHGFVYLCMGATAIAFTALVLQGYNFYRYVRPALQEARLKADEELLEEGKYKSAT